MSDLILKDTSKKKTFLKKSNSNKNYSFSLSFWLLKKLKKELIVWYFLTIPCSFFYYQASFGLKVWSNYNTTFPFSLFLVNFNSRGSLLIYVFFCFFVGNLLTSLICDYLKSYVLELCRFYLRGLVFRRDTQRKSMSDLINEIELFSPLFVSPPQRIFTAIVNIIFAFVFLTNFRKVEENPFAFQFVIISSIILAIVSFFTYQIQSKINQRLNKFRQQENLAMEKCLKNSKSSQKINNLITANFKKTRSLLKKKTFSYLPNLIIPGLGILFCFIYAKKFGINWEIEEFVDIGIIANSIQVIFWKVKDITDNLLELSKIKAHYKWLQKALEKSKKIKS